MSAIHRDGRLPAMVVSVLLMALASGGCAARANRGQAGKTADARASSARPPNVLFVVFDDLNRHIPPYGNDIVKAPNLERLARRAVRFDRAYAQYPLCSPSRTSFLSGRRPEQARIFDNSTPARAHLGENAVFLPQHFRANGYFSARVGKIFHIGLDDPRSWDVSEEGTPGNRIIYQPQEPEKLGLRPHIIEQGDHAQHAKGESGARYVLDVDDTALVDNMIARRAAELLQQGAVGDKPFFLAVGFRRPHLPWMAPKKYYDLYSLDDLPVAPANPTRWQGVPEGQAAMPDEEYRQSLRAYYAAISFADAQFGVVLDAMDRLHLWDNTVVVVLGDHGYHLGTRMWWGKGTPYDDDAAAPLLVAAPGMRSGTACARPVEFLDIYPTLVELAGLPSAPDVAGRSFRGLLEDPASGAWQARGVTVTGKNGRYHGRAISVDGYRLIEYDGGQGGVELYDIGADPRELHNLAADPRHAQVLRDLRQAALGYASEVAPL